MINDVINVLEDTVNIHESLMMYAHSIGLQGIKRFNRYESIENLKRVNNFKNYMIEFKLGNYNRVNKLETPGVNSYDELINAIVTNRTNIINILENEYSSSKDLVYCDMLNKIVKDFKKELEVFTRIKERLAYITNQDMKKTYLFDWDEEMHEYMKKKED